MTIQHSYLQSTNNVIAMAASSPKSGFLKAASDGDLALLKRLALEVENGGGFVKDFELIKDAKGSNALHFAAAAGKTQICKFLLEKLKFDVDFKNKQGNTPLMKAIMEERLQTAVYLIEYGAGIEIRNRIGRAALDCVAETGPKELLLLLLSKGARVAPDVNSKFGTPLHSACYHKKKELVKILLENGADVNWNTNLFTTPLMLSIYVGSYDCMELLLKAGANPNLSSFDKTPLKAAARNNDTSIIKRLLKAGADPNVVDSFGFTPLEHAALCGNIAAVKTLIPLTSQISSCPNWSVDGILKHVNSVESIAQREIMRKNYLEVSKANGRAAFKRKDYAEAILCYQEAKSADPTDAVVLSNMSLCWTLLNQGDDALQEAQACVALKPDWAEAHYREGAAYMLLNEYSKASKAFSEALKLDPNDEEIKKAHREAGEAEFGIPVSEILRAVHI